MLKKVRSTAWKKYIKYTKTSIQAFHFSGPIKQTLNQQIQLDDRSVEMFGRSKVLIPN